MVNEIKQINIFVSSTFKDMDLERDLLKGRIEPLLNEYFSKSRVHIHFVDLRQTVETDRTLSEEQREMLILKTCRQEIKECYPFFIAFLGHMYGWIPDIDTKDFIEEKEAHLPAGVPIPTDKLSVTALEICRGLFPFSEPNHNGIVFIREESSYSRCEDKEKFYEENDKPESAYFAGALRDWLQEENPDITTVPYVLPQEKRTDEEQNSWEQLVFEAIRDKIEPSLSGQSTGYLQARQDSFAYSRIKSFHGRRYILDALMTRLTSPDCPSNTLLCGQVGSGRTSIACMLYHLLSKQDNTLCLFFLMKAAPERVSTYAIIRYLLEITLKRLDGKAVIPDDKKEMAGMFMDYIQKAKERFTIYLIGDFFHFSSEASQGEETLARKYLNLSLSGSRKVMLLDPIITDSLITRRPDFQKSSFDIPNNLTEDDLQQFLASQRSAVRSRMMKHSSALKINWLVPAIRMINTLNRQDFLTIRRNPSSDNEADIVNYILDFIGQLPEEVPDMLLMWVKRSESFFEPYIYKKYIAVMSITRVGWTDSELATFLGVTEARVADFRQTLGQDIIENFLQQGRYRVKDVLAAELYRSVSSDLKEKVCWEVSDILRDAPSSLMPAILGGNISIAKTHLENGVLVNIEDLFWYVLHAKNLLEDALGRIVSGEISPRLLNGYVNNLAQLNFNVKDLAHTFSQEDGLRINRFLSLHLLRTLRNRLIASDMVAETAVCLTDFWLLKSKVHYVLNEKHDEDDCINRAMSLSENFFPIGAEYFFRAVYEKYTYTLDRDTTRWLVEHKILPKIKWLSEVKESRITTYLRTTGLVVDYFLATGRCSDALGLLHEAIQHCLTKKLGYSEVSNLISRHLCIAQMPIFARREWDFVDKTIHPLLLELWSYFWSMDLDPSYYQAISSYLNYLSTIAPWENRFEERLKEELVYWLRHFELACLGHFTISGNAFLKYLLQAPRFCAVWCSMAASVVLIGEKNELAYKPFIFDDLSVASAQSILLQVFHKTNLQNGDDLFGLQPLIGSYVCLVYATLHSKVDLNAFFDQEQELLDWIGDGVYGVRVWPGLSLEMLNYVNAYRMRYTVWDENEMQEAFHKGLKRFRAGYLNAARAIFIFCQNSSDIRLARISLINLLILYLIYYPKTYEKEYACLSETERQDQRIIELENAHSHYLQGEHPRSYISHPDGYEY